MHHPTLPLDRWAKKLRLPDSFAECDELLRHYRIEGPGKLAICEKLRDDVLLKHDLGYSVPSDLFLWSTDSAGPPYLTRLGGSPFLPESASWPLDSVGEPCVFLAQICFADSHDIVPSQFHNKTMLLFAPWTPWAKKKLDTAWLDYANTEVAVVDIDTPRVWSSHQCPEHSTLGFQLFGVRHRTRNFPQAESRLESVGFEKGGWCLANYCATQISPMSFFMHGNPWGMSLKQFEALTASQFAVLPHHFIACLDSLEVGEDHPFVVDSAHCGSSDSTHLPASVDGRGFSIMDSGIIHVRQLDGRLRASSASG